MFRNKKNGGKVLAVLAFTALTSSQLVWAQGLDDEAALNADPIGVVSNPTLPVDGQYHVPSEAEKLNRQTQELIQRTNDMVQKNVATKRNANEKKLANELQTLFTGEVPPTQDHVETRQSSVGRVETKIEEPKKEEEIDASYKVIPYAGGHNMTGEGEVNFQSQVNAGLRLETLVMESRVGIGVGFNYAQTNVRDNRYTNFGFFGANNAPEFRHRVMTGELYGKFYLINKNVLRPYVGAGVAYNNVNLSHSNANAFNNGFQQWGNGLNQDYTSNYASGSALIGTDVLFTKRFGLNLEFKYSRPFSSGFNSNNIGLNQNLFGYDQAYMQQLGEQMDNAAIMAVNLGLVVAF